MPNEKQQDLEDGAFLYVFSIFGEFLDFSCPYDFMKKPRVNQAQHLNCMVSIRRDHDISGAAPGPGLDI